MRPSEKLLSSFHFYFAISVVARVLGLPVFKLLLLLLLLLFYDKEMGYGRTEAEQALAAANGDVNAAAAQLLG
jgi:hypothetical protein